MKLINVDKEYEGSKLVKNNITIDLLNSNILGEAVYSIVNANEIVNSNMDMCETSRYIIRLENAINILKTEVSRYDNFELR